MKNGVVTLPKCNHEPTEEEKFLFIVDITRDVITILWIAML